MDPRAQPLADWFINFLRANGVTVTVTSTRRGVDEQRKLYARYLAGLSKYPAAPPGHSQHDKGLAFDLHLSPPVYRQAGEVWESLGFTWGGRFDDEIHFDFRRRA